MENRICDCDMIIPLLFKVCPFCKKVHGKILENKKREKKPEEEKEKPPILPCIACGKDFKEKRGDKRVFCCRSCASKHSYWRRGFNYTCDTCRQKFSSILFSKICQVCKLKM